MKSLLTKIVFSGIFLGITSTSTALPSNLSAFPLLKIKNENSITTAPKNGLEKSAAMSWVRTGTEHLYNNSKSSETPVWAFSQRDTVIYDVLGNEIISMSSMAHKGWDMDSLMSIDSAKYSNGNVVETISKQFDHPFYSGLKTQGSRSTFDYLHSRKTVVITSFSWADSTKSWIPSSKDSAVYSSEIQTSDWPEDYSNLINYYRWYFNKGSNKWEIFFTMSRISSECTNTRAVFIESINNDATGPAEESKLIMDFASQKMTINNCISWIGQLKDNSTQTFVNDIKYEISYISFGVFTCSEVFNWDASHSMWISNTKFFTFPDSYGNDTLLFNLNYDTTLSMWDTSYTDRFTRKYDSFGNNTEIIESSYSNSTKTWSATSNKINTFAQINPLSVTTAIPSSQKNISYNRVGNKLIFSGKGIQGIIICNTQGRVVASIKQNTSDNLVFSTEKLSPLVAGSYVAKILTSTGSTSLRLPICK